MIKPPQSFTRIVGALLLLCAVVVQVLQTPVALAAQITNRSLTLRANGTDGGSAPGAAGHFANHFFQLTLPGGSTVGSIKFEYCTTAANSVAIPACVTPTGLDLSTATLGTENGVTGFSINHISNNAVYLSRSAAAIGTNVNVSYRFDHIINPTNAAGVTFFTRITTYASTDTTGSSTDAGNVTASTNQPIIVTGTMPESLVFCTGQQISMTGGVPDCTTATAGSITFNQLFSPVDTAITASQMAASTNAGSGYAITVNGTTLTSGSNTITGLGTPSASIKGISQFGLNLRANTSAAASSFPGTGVYASADITAASNGTNLRGEPKTGYDTADTFTFNNGGTVADSGQGGSPTGTDAQIYTSSYIVNVPGSQPAGTYTSTLTYICTPTF